MHIDVAAFLESLKIMGIGMLGIFIVTMVLIGVMVLLTKAFPEKKEDKEEKIPVSGNLRRVQLVKEVNMIWQIAQRSVVC